MQQNKQYYDNFFRVYPVNVHNNSARFSSVSSLLSGKVLDVACGTGTLSDYYKNDYFGIDFSDVAINKAKENRRDSASFAVADFTKKLSLTGESFDSVYVGEFLEHIENDDVVFQNILKLAKPNARVVISVPNADRVPDESHCRTFTVPQIRKDYSKYGKITFHNWSGFKKRILFSIDLNEKNENIMSLVMIVKNEGKGLERAIISALPIVDRVVISVDSKSVDKTEEIAKLYADELKTHIWENDFSKARNFAQENVKSKWILFLDGHEYIESYGDFKEKMLSEPEGIFVTVRMETGLTFLFPRIYRSYIRFRNAVHNLNECKTKRSAPTFVIVHDREGGQDYEFAKLRNEQREMMMPKELKNQIEENPKNARPYFHLANFYMMRKQKSLARKYYKKTIKFTKSKDQKYLCLLHLGALQLEKGQTLRAYWNYQKADELLPNRWESAHSLGVFFLTQNKYKKAVNHLVQALTPNKRRYSYEPMKQDAVHIWDLIGHCLTKLDKMEQAAIAWKRALELAESKTDKKLFQTKINLVKTLRKK